MAEAQVTIKHSSSCVTVIPFLFVFRNVLEWRSHSNVTDNAEPARRNRPLENSVAGWQAPSKGGCFLCGHQSELMTVGPASPGLGSNCGATL